MAGFGLSSFGVGAFGLGTPAVTPDPPTGVTGSRYINPATGDYEIDGVTRHYKQMPKNMQRVLLALSTVQLSATSVPRFGSKLPRKMGTSFERETEQAIRFALAFMTDIEQSILILAIRVERGRNSRAQATIVYRDYDSADDKPQQVTTVL